LRAYGQKSWINVSIQRQLTQFFHLSNFCYSPSRKNSVFVSWSDKLVLAISQTRSDSVGFWSFNVFWFRIRIEHQVLMRLSWKTAGKEGRITDKEPLSVGRTGRTHRKWFLVCYSTFFVCCLSWKPH
jgi:hypothetical protein